MQNVLRMNASPSRTLWHLLWGTVLVGASAALSFGFACAVPLAGFAAVAALTAGRTEAVGLVLAVFLTNQLIGFFWLHYPVEPTTLAWGGGLGLVAVIATLAAIWIAGRAHIGNRMLRIGAVFLVAFAVYEGLLFAATAMSGSGFEAYQLPVIGRVLLINLVSFIGFLAAEKLLVASLAKHNPAAQLTHIGIGKQAG